MDKNTLHIFKTWTILNDKLKFPFTHKKSCNHNFKNQFSNFIQYLAIR